MGRAPTSLTLSHRKLEEYIICKRNITVLVKKNDFVVSHEGIRGCVRRLVGWSVGKTFVGGQRQDGERLWSCIRTCFCIPTRLTVETYYVTTPASFVLTNGVGASAGHFLVAS